MITFVRGRSDQSNGADDACCMPVGNRRSAVLVYATSFQQSTTHAVMLLPCAALPAGNADALYIMARQNQQRFEFIFTDLTDRQPGSEAALQALVAAYEASRPYRELRLRGVLALMLLPLLLGYAPDLQTPAYS
jgi:hypothetical protein